MVLYEPVLSCLSRHVTASALSKKVVCLPSRPALCQSCLSQWKGQDTGTPVLAKWLNWYNAETLKTRDKIIDLSYNQSSG